MSLTAGASRGFYPLSIGTVTREMRDALVVGFVVPGALRERFRFTPGQFLTLRAIVDGAEIRRSYSICSVPGEGALRVAIKLVADGRFSQWAHEALGAGMTLDVAPPDGRFAVPPARAGAGRYLGVAAGSGITPLLSMMSSTLATEPHARFTLVYGNRSSSSTMFLDELHDLKDRYLDRFVVHFIMSRERREIEALHGRIDGERCDALFSGWIDVATFDAALLCGPETMMADVRTALRARGMAAQRIVSERFTAVGRRSTRTTTIPPAAAPSMCSAYAILDGVRRSFSVAKGTETLLEAGLRQGLDLPYSCTSGVCSTCRVHLLEGEVDMDVRYALEDYEIARGAVLMCQSYAVSATLGIDVDAH